jgi:very-short-patch-repair endonuclease
MSRDEQYQQLLQQTDLNSEFERVVLQEIYQQGYKLPDTAQKLIPQANSKPDFCYRDAGVVIFCDGLAHNHPEQQQQDRIDRDLRYATGYYVLTLRYDQDWKAELAVLSSLL